MSDAVTVTAVDPSDLVTVTASDVSDAVTVSVVTADDQVTVTVSNDQGPQGESWAETFESVSQNLNDYPKALNYTGGVLTSIVFTLPSGTITKTLNYTDGVLTSIVLSGDTPGGIPLTKTLTYSAGVLVGISYS